MSPLFLLLASLPTTITCYAGGDGYTWQEHSDGVYFRVDPRNLLPDELSLFKARLRGDILFLTQGHLEAVVNLKTSELELTGGWKPLRGGCRLRG